MMFTILVVGEVKPQMLPYHQFEVTGWEKYVREIQQWDDLDQIKARLRHQPLREILRDMGYPPTPVWVGEPPDIQGEHQYRYVVIDGCGHVVNAVRRTNPDYKWDSYEIRGHRNYIPDYFLLKSRHWFSRKQKRRNVCIRRELDFDGMVANGNPEYGGIALYAYVKDGQWVGQDGKTKEQWEQEFRILLRDLPEDAKLTVLDVHV